MDPLPVPAGIHPDHPSWALAYSKLGVFGLTQFAKVTYMDLDMLVLQNLDELFCYAADEYAGEDPAAWCRGIPCPWPLGRARQGVALQAKYISLRRLLGLYRRPAQVHRPDPDGDRVSHLGSLHHGPQRRHIPQIARPAALPGRQLALGPRRPAAASARLSIGYQAAPELRLLGGHVPVRPRATRRHQEHPLCVSPAGSFALCLWSVAKAPCSPQMVLQALDLPLGPGGGPYALHHALPPRLRLFRRALRPRARREPFQVAHHIAPVPLLCTRAPAAPPHCPDCREAPRRPWAQTPAGTVKQNVGGSKPHEPRRLASIVKYRPKPARLESTSMEAVDQSQIVGSRISSMPPCPNSKGSG